MYWEYYFRVQQHQCSPFVSRRNTIFIYRDYKTDSISLIISDNAHNVVGKKLFHVKYIRRSYRIRGNLPRIQINTNAYRVLFRDRLIWPHILANSNVKKSVTVMILITSIIMYSAINRSANPLLLYSILNPDTISDSPSAKSKGARLVSAKIEINQINKRWGNILDKLVKIWKLIWFNIKDS